MRKSLFLIPLFAVCLTACGGQDQALRLGMRAFDRAAEFDLASKHFQACIEYRTALIHFVGVTDDKFNKSRDTVKSLEKVACKKAGV
jgi:hypothetical protein